MYIIDLEPLERAYNDLRQTPALESGIASISLVARLRTFITSVGNSFSKRVSLSNLADNRIIDYKIQNVLKQVTFMDWRDMDVEISNIFAKPVTQSIKDLLEAAKLSRHVYEEVIPELLRTVALYSNYPDRLQNALSDVTKAPSIEVDQVMELFRKSTINNGTDTSYRNVAAKDEFKSNAEYLELIDNVNEFYGLIADGRGNGNLHQEIIKDVERIGKYISALQKRLDKLESKDISRATVDALADWIMVTARSVEVIGLLRSHYGLMYNTFDHMNESIIEHLT